MGRLQVNGDILIDRLMAFEIMGCLAFSVSEWILNSCMNGFDPSNQAAFQANLDPVGMCGRLC